MKLLRRKRKEVVKVEDIYLNEKEVKELVDLTDSKQ